MTTLLLAIATAAPPTQDLCFVGHGRARVEVAVDGESRGRLRAGQALVCVDAEPGAYEVALTPRSALGWRKALRRALHPRAPEPMPSTHGLAYEGPLPSGWVGTLHVYAHEASVVEVLVSNGRSVQVRTN